SDSPRDGLLEKADVILVIDSDVPWIKSRFRPSPEALIYHIDADPLKVNMSLFNIGADISAQADANNRQPWKGNLILDLIQSPLCP
ncbi:hypothetical protein diail_1296, partial [Diaporthe ilicicola]